MLRYSWTEKKSLLVNPRMRYHAVAKAASKRVMHVCRSLFRGHITLNVIVSYHGTVELSGTQEDTNCKAFLNRLSGIRHPCYPWTRLVRTAATVIGSEKCSVLMEADDEYFFEIEQILRVRLTLLEG